RYFHGALTQRLASAVDGGVSAADYGHSCAELHLRSAHADVAQERQAVKHAFLILAFSSHAVGVDQAHGQHAGVVILFQIVPADVFAHFRVRLDRYSKFEEAFDLTIEHVLRQNPIRNPAAIQSAHLWRLLEDRYLVTEPRQLVRSAVTGGTRTDDGDFLAVGGSPLHHVFLQCLPEIAKESLDPANRDGLIIFPAVAGLLAWVVADSARHRWKRHVFLDERVRV